MIHVASNAANSVNRSPEPASGVCPASEVAVSPNTNANRAPDCPNDRTAEPPTTQPPHDRATRQLLARLVFLSIAHDQAEVMARDPQVPRQER